MSLTVVHDIAWRRTLRYVPRADLPAVFAVRDKIIADAPNLPALLDVLSVEALPEVRYTRYVLCTPWVVEYSWSITTQTLVLRTISAPDPPF